MALLLYITCALSVAFIISRLLHKRRARGIPYPPGPPGLPILENILDIPKEKEYEIYAQWGKQYGDVCSVSTFGTRLIILNSPKAVTDLMDKRSAIYSNRPTYTMAGKLCGWNDVLVLLPYAARLRSYRTMVHKMIGTKSALQEFDGFMEREAILCARRLLEDPNDFIGPIRKGVGAIILMISHGYNVKNEHDALVRAADDATDQIGILLTPGTFVVDLIPMLRFLPRWVPFHLKAQRWKALLHKMTDDSYSFAKAAMIEGRKLPNLVSRFMDGRQVSKEEESNIKWAASSLYSGGADTPVSAMHSFILAMVLYPEVQAKAQAEIDRIVGTDRLPTLADKESLTYIVCLMKEVLRWGHTSPLGAPHCVTRDDVYNGFFIPKGSVVIANIWHFLHDPDVYPDPHTFDPERHISSKYKPAQRDPYDVCFGIGRRTCPGTQLSDSMLFIFMVTLLATYKINKVKTSDRVGEPKYDFTSGVLIRPKAFRAALTPRSAAARALLNEEEV